jgi:hypothetical protein
MECYMGPWDESSTSHGPFNDTHGTDAVHEYAGPWDIWEPVGQTHGPVKHAHGATVVLDQA